MPSPRLEEQVAQKQLKAICSLQPLQLSLLPSFCPSLARSQLSKPLLFSMDSLGPAWAATSSVPAPGPDAIPGKTLCSWTQGGLGDVCVLSGTEGGMLYYEMEWAVFFQTRGNVW